MPAGGAFGVGGASAPSPWMAPEEDSPRASADAAPPGRPGRPRRGRHRPSASRSARVTCEAEVQPIALASSAARNPASRFGRRRRRNSCPSNSTRPFEQFVDGRLPHDPALEQQTDAITQCLGVRQDVAGEEHRGRRVALRPRMMSLISRRPIGSSPDMGSSRIDEFGLVDQGLCQADALQHALGVLLGRLVRAVARHADEVDQARRVRRTAHVSAGRSNSRPK